MYQMFFPINTLVRRKKGQKGVKMDSICMNLEKLGVSLSPSIGQFFVILPFPY